MAGLPTARLTTGDAVLTTGEIGTDFGLPLVEPWRLKRTPSHRRVVSNAVRARGGIVVWFTDGTKSRPVHGRTAWATP